MGTYPEDTTFRRPSAHAIVSVLLSTRVHRSDGSYLTAEEKVEMLRREAPALLIDAMTEGEVFA